MHSAARARGVSGRFLRQGGWFWAAALGLAICLPFIFDGTHFLSVCVLFGLWGSVNLMWMLVLGTAGIWSFATLAIVGASAYLAIFMSVELGWSWPAMLAIATATGAVLGLLIALPAIRLRGVYFALLTFGLVELFRSYVSVEEALGQFDGIYGADSFIPRSLLGTKDAAYIGYAAAMILLIVALVVYRLVDGGRLGLLLRTARENESFAQAVGVGIVRARAAVFLISSAMLGLVGGFYAAFFRGASPTIFAFDTLLLLFAMVVVGGVWSPKGVLIATALLLFIDQYFLEEGASRLIAAGVLMLLITLFTERGLAGVPVQLQRWAASQEIFVLDGRRLRLAGVSAGGPLGELTRGSPQGDKGEKVDDSEQTTPHD